MIKSYSLRQSIAYQTRYQIYILSAQDEDLQQYETQHIIEQAGITQVKKYLIQSAEDWNGFYSTSQNYQLFPEPTAYILQLEKNALSSKSLIDLKPGEEEIYIIQTQQFKHVFLDHLDKNPNTLWYRLYTPNPQELWGWLLQTLKAHHYHIAPDVAPWFLQQDSIQWRHYRQLWEKIKLGHAPQATLQIMHMQELLGDILEDDWQPLIEAWMQNEKQRIHQYFPKIDTQNDFSLLIWLLHRNLQVWLALHNKQKNPNQIFQQFKVWNKHIPLFQKTLPLWSQEKIERTLCKLHEADKHYKCFRTLQARYAFKHLLLEGPDV